MLNLKSKNVAFTISAKNRLPSAMICRESFLKHNPDVDFIIFLADLSVSREDFAVIQEAALLISCLELRQLNQFRTTNKLEEIAYKYDVIEFCTAIKPFCIEYLFWSGYDNVAYFDPDIKFFDSVSAVYKALDHYDCVLTPHITKPVPNDGKTQQDLQILSCGAYNLGFGAWQRSQKCLDFMTWWGGKLQNLCYHDVGNHIFVDQYWMGFAPCFMDTCIMHYPGYNCAYWNLHERQYELHGDKWYVNGKPLVFYHFSGLKYTDPEAISRYQDRFTLPTRPDVNKLFYGYVEDILKLNGLQKLALPYYYYIEPEARKQYSQVFAKQVNPWVNKDNHIGINVVGYFSYVAGTSEAARNFVQKIYSAGVPYALCAEHTQKPKISLQAEREFSVYYTDRPRYDTSIFFVNLDNIHAVKMNKPSLFGRKNIGVFWWELEDSLPFTQHFSCVDEAMCFTKFMQKILQKFAPKDMKIHKLPYPFIAPKPGTYKDANTCRVRLKIPSDAFVFYFSFDYASSYERKNPEGVIEAIRKGMGNRKNVRLLIKTLNANLYPAEVKRLDEACKESEIPVTTFDGPIPREDMYALTNMCDAYISLHRSEGAGLGILEALYFGKPVIATGYGGNMEFMNEENSCVVDWKLTPITNSFFNYYQENALWAEPNIEAAAASVEHVLADEDFREEMGRQAHASVVQYADMFKFNEAFYKVLTNE